MKSAVPYIFLLSTIGGMIPSISTAQPVAGGDQRVAVPDQPTNVKETPAASTGFAAHLTLEASDSSSGLFMQVVPDVDYAFGRWDVKFGVPLDSIDASSTGQASSAHRGLGDMFLSLSYTVDSDQVSFVTTVVGTAPTGDSATGLGTGQATWNWTNHVGHGFGRLTPYVEAGVGNSLNSVASLSARLASGRTGRIRGVPIPAQPYATLGKQAQVGAGIDLAVSGAVTLGMAAYDTMPWGSQTAISRFVVPATAQRGRTTISRGTKGQRFFEVNTVTQGTASLTRDDGVGASVAISPTPYLDLGLDYSRSLPMRLDVVTVTVGTNLTAMFRKTS